MTEIKTADVRQSFLEYFRTKDHRLVESSPVIPYDDPTILFINAGMNQFKDVFTGKRRPDFRRAASSQKCIRAGGKHNDLDNVGFTARHHTFFEMLGNFSFGDYFKAEAIEFCWEWVSRYLELPPDRLFATVHEDDDEAFDLWEKIAPELKNGRVLRFGKKDNYWSMGDIGPCGPCSEVHFDRGEKFGTGPDDVVNGETERFVEIWNLVFMQFERTADGRLIDLPKPSVDTGAGLERIAAVMQKVDSNYSIDIFQNLVQAVSDLTGAKYSGHESSHHVIADHIRTLTFAIADGAGISNEGRGYVLRRILRRAARHGRELGASELFLHKLVPTLADEMGETYPEIREKQDYVINVIRAEEESFARTLDTGCELFSTIARRVKSAGGTVVPGEEVFRLYDTYGFPYDLTEVIAAEQGLTLDRAGFDKAMQEQQERSREASNFATFTFGIPVEWSAIPGDTPFVRDSLSISTRILNSVEVTAQETDQSRMAIQLNKTPFYVESGGQISDTGRIFGEKFEFTVDSANSDRGIVAHIGKLVRGSPNDLKEDTPVTAEVDAERRWDIMRNHTATHLAHAALRQVLGDHVRQSGSYVGPDRLRFDFSHHQPMTPEEIAEVERIVNEQILLGTEVSTAEMAAEKARQSGAMALFGEKYGETVRVVSVGRFSKELCGGIHVQNTSQIGPFFMTLETGVASGVRRLEAITGRQAQKRMFDQKRFVAEVGRIVSRPETEAVAGIEQLKADNAALQKEVRKLKAELVSGAGQTVGSVKQVGDVKLWTHSFGSTDTETMSAWIDQRKTAKEPVMALAIGTIDEKLTLMFAASPKAVKWQAIHVGRMTEQLLSGFGGRGGGKADFARGGLPPETDLDDVFAGLEGLLKQSRE